MPPLPKRKPALLVLPRLLAGGVLGFVAAVLAVRLTGSGGSSFPAPAVNARVIPSPSVPATGKQRPPLPGPADFQKMEPREKLTCALQLRGIPAEQRLALLQACLQSPGPERSALLSLLLAEWTESEPSQAAEWIFSHLKGAEARKCLADVLRTWAARDGKSLAEWANDHFQKYGRDLTSAAMDALQRHDPLWFARMSEMECHRDSVWSGMEFDSLRAPGAAKAISSQLEGHVAYISDADEMGRAVALGSTGRHGKQKWGWNELFESTAVRWYAEDPAACDHWLNGFPVNAQAAARHFITEAENKEKAEAAAEAFPAEVLSGPVPETQAAAAVSAPPPRPDSAAPAAGAAEQQTSAWRQWWRADPAEAEAFLNSAAWPEDLKFRARAQAYASAP